MVIDNVFDVCMWIKVQLDVGYVISCVFTLEFKDFDSISPTSEMYKNIVHLKVTN